MVLAHPFVLMDMLRAKGVVLAKNHPHRKEDYRNRDQSYDEYYFHFCTQKSMQRYAKKLKVESGKWKGLIFLRLLRLFLKKNTRALAYMK